MNQASISGFLYTDPTTERYENAGNKYVFCEFGVAVQRDYKKENRATADYIWIKTANKQAEFCEKYLIKGRKVIVEGSIRTNRWKDSKDKMNYKTFIEAHRIEICDSKYSENNISDTGAYISSNIDVSGLEGADFQTESSSI